MDDSPVRFTDEQRRLFQRVARLIRSNPSAFQEAGQWLDAGGDLGNTEERARNLRGEKLAEARARRKHGRSYLCTSGDRTTEARVIRDERAKAAKDLIPYETIRAAAYSLLLDPPNYDASRPELGERLARRVLLMAWIFTDPADLRTNTIITRLQTWDWGDVPAEFRFTEDGDLDANSDCAINRLYARTALIDGSLPKWTQMVGDALRYLEERGLVAGMDGDGVSASWPNFTGNLTFVNSVTNECHVPLGVQTWVVTAPYDDSSEEAAASNGSHADNGLPESPGTSLGELDEPQEYEVLGAGVRKRETGTGESGLGAQQSSSFDRPPVDRPRRGRLKKEDSAAKQAHLLATLRQHPSMKDDPKSLAKTTGVSESTARRWIGAEEQKYLESRAAMPSDDVD